MENNEKVIDKVLQIAACVKNILTEEYEVLFVAEPEAVEFARTRAIDRAKLRNLINAESPYDINDVIVTAYGALEVAA